MQLSKDTIAILKNFAQINSNLRIVPGNKISTMSTTKDIFAEVEVPETFDKEAGIYNLNELLGVFTLFDKPEVVMDYKDMTIKEGRNKIKYVYADTSLLTYPQKPINMPTPEISFTLTSSQLQKIQKASSTLSLSDLAFIGDGKTITAQVLDSKNPTSNTCEIDLEAPTSDTFKVFLKIDKLKLIDGSYDVEISSKRISKFAHKDIKLVVFIAVESTSEFSV